MAERYYGGNKKSYGVTERQDGWIELCIYHNNVGMHQYLQKHIKNPSSLLRHYDAYSRSNTRAQRWLAKVMADYRAHFEQNLVEIILNPTAPHMAVAVPVIDIDLDDNLGSLWKSVLASSVSLFRTATEDPLLAIFDEKGFFLSQEAQQVYNRVKSLPHIYVARLESESTYYFGISNQPGGRWKRSHAYHLGGLAYEILGTRRYDDQDHSNWVRRWFEPFEPRHHGSYYVIRMKEKIIISFFVPQPQASKAELKKAESLLIDIARRRGLIILNKRG